MSITSLSVMVVAGPARVRAAACRLLDGLGVTRVCEAADGRAALELLADRARRLDVVMVELGLAGVKQAGAQLGGDQSTGMDGIEFIGHVGQRGLARAVLVVSALDAALLDTVHGMARGYGLQVLDNVETPLTAAGLAAALAAYERDTAAQADEPVRIGATEIREALARGEIRPWFQPQVALADGAAVGVEALARWQRADGQVVAPQHFIGLLEREGLVEPFTDLMLEQACQWCGRWREAGLVLRLSVNISPAVLADTTAADRYQRIVLAQGIDPAGVVLELTESSVLADAPRALGILARLRLKGFGLSIDDFGTGYSSLAQLSQIPFTELKIDQGFVAGAHAQPRKRAVVEASVELARKLGLHVVAEGVATLEDWRMLAELGCGAAQGHLVSAPVPPEALPGVLARWRPPAP